MTLLRNAGVDAVHHFAPLHYVPFIARSKLLMCKPSLAKAGYNESHLRSKSCKHDVGRGFGRYAFLTLDKTARITQAKLAAGFPHVAIEVLPETVDAVEYGLCRFNVAMTRQLRRGNKPGFPESPTNGKYYDTEQIPTARTAEEKAALLAEHFPRTMIEVLIPGDLPLIETTKLVCFSDDDATLAKNAFASLGVKWSVETRAAPGPYNRNAKYVAQVIAFMSRAIKEPAWKGNGLEFDRV